MAQKKGAGGKPQTYDENTGRYGSSIATPAESKRLKELGIETAAGLSKRDWARIYHRLGEIEGSGYIEKGESGEMLVSLHKMDEEDNPKLVVLGGTYEKPIVKSVMEFQSEEEMFDRIERLKNGFD